MSDRVFPATTADDFPSSLHGYLAKADQTQFFFPKPEQMVAPPMPEWSGRQERIIKFAYFNYWLAALRVYYINAAWVYAYEFMAREEAGEAYVNCTALINSRYAEAEKELYEHYGYDHPR